MNLTRRQRQVLAAIDSLADQKGYAPTFREVAAELGIGSVNGVLNHLRRLKTLGCVQWTEKTPRTLTTIRHSD